MWIVLALTAALAVLGPLFGADTRDGRDWHPNHFWLPRGRLAPDRVRKTGSRAPEAEAPAAAAPCRSVPAAG